MMLNKLTLTLSFLFAQVATTPPSTNPPIVTTFAKLPSCGKRGFIAGKFQQNNSGLQLIITDSTTAKSGTNLTAGGGDIPVWLLCYEGTWKVIQQVPQKYLDTLKK